MLVVGDAATAAQIRRKLSGNPALNATVVGRVGEPERTGGRPDKVLGTLEELPELLEGTRSSGSWSSRPSRAGEDVVDDIRLAKACGVNVAVLPRMLEVIGIGGGVRRHQRPDAPGRPRLRAVAVLALLKRSLDVVVADVALILLSPLLLVVAVAVKLQLAGPGPLPPDAHRPRGARLPDAQVPHDGAGRRRAQGRARRAQPGGAAVQDRQRPAHDRSGGSCAATRSTSCPSSSTCCAAT